VVEIVGKDWWHWLIAKIIAGSGIGAVQATLTPYINEHAPGQIRGFLLVCYSL
jgi:MFS family permease